MFGDRGAYATYDGLMVALRALSVDPDVADIFIIGGARVYEEALQLSECKRVFLTEVLSEFPADTYLPPIDTNVFTLDEIGQVVTDGPVLYQFLTYIRKDRKEEVTSPETKVETPVSSSSSSTVSSPVSSSLHSSRSETKIEIRTDTSTLPLLATAALCSVVNPEERRYLDIIKNVIDHGVRKQDRTGVGTVSKFGEVARYSLRDGRIPLLTTKEVMWRFIVEELVWLINGKTDARDLQEKRVPIWDANGRRAFLDALGLRDREEFDLGPIYGFQWRHFGATYVNSRTDYKGQGVDQLLEVIETIKKDPHSRRTLINAWNAADLKKMALPPCHVLCQFYVANGELSCIMYQRSCDLGLGVPFNIASYSLLTHLIAHVCGLRAGEFCHMMGDTHVYLNHVEPLRRQIERTPTAFPTIRFKRDLGSVTEFVSDDVELIGYTPQPAIYMPMAV